MKAFLGAAISAVTLVAMPAMAGEFKVVPHGSYVLDLDTADGNFSMWKTEEVADINALQAHITLLRKGSGKYLPSLSIFVEGQHNRVLIQFGAMPKSGPLVGTVRLFKGDTEAASDMVLLAPEFAEPFDIRASWTPDGKLAFDIYSKAAAGVGQGFEHHEVDLGEPVTRLQVNGSTGEVEFNKLELGNYTP